MKTRLKEVRKSAGYSQQEAASLFNVSLGTYRNWEQGRVVMNAEQLIKAAALFDSTVDYILTADAEVSTEDRQLAEVDAILRKLTPAGRTVLLDVAHSLLVHYREVER